MDKMIFLVYFGSYISMKSISIPFICMNSEDKYSRVCTAELVEIPRLLEAVTSGTPGNTDGTRVLGRFFLSGQPLPGFCPD